MQICEFRLVIDLKNSLVIMLVFLVYASTTSIESVSDFIMGKQLRWN